MGNNNNNNNKNTKNDRVNVVTAISETMNKHSCVKSFPHSNIRKFVKTIHVLLKYIQIIWGEIIIIDTFCKRISNCLPT